METSKRFCLKTGSPIYIYIYTPSPKSFLPPLKLWQLWSVQVRPSGSLDEKTTCSSWNDANIPVPRVIKCHKSLGVGKFYAIFHGNTPLYNGWSSLSIIVLNNGIYHGKNIDMTAILMEIMHGNTVMETWYNANMIAYDSPKICQHVSLIPANLEFIHQARTIKQGKMLISPCLRGHMLCQKYCLELLVFII